MHKAGPVNICNLFEKIQHYIIVTTWRESINVDTGIVYIVGSFSVPNAYPDFVAIRLFAYELAKYLEGYTWARQWNMFKALLTWAKVMAHDSHLSL